MKELPGETEAKQLGYDLHMYSGERDSAFYMKGQLCLRVSSKGEAIISASYKMVELRIGPIAFPHERFHIFEQQMIDCLPKK